MEYIDQTGYKITLDRPPLRIVSLVPSQTELLYYLGIHPVGQTIFCFHPKEQFKNAKKIGGTKKIQMDKLKALNPDLIIGNKEENQKEQIEELRNEYAVWLSDINTLENAYDMIRSVGKLVNKETQANRLAAELEAGFDGLKDKPKSSALYLIWKDPYMVAGQNTFINSILSSSGYTNAISDINSRYPKISLKEIQELNPDSILLSSEPFPFQESHVVEMKELLPHSEVKIVDGELYSWYGPRLLKTLNYLRK